jgi:pyroglutamyl-peptidase
MKPILVTGFEPYGGMTSNPAFQAMQTLDGSNIGGRPIVGRVLPVSMAKIHDAIGAVLREIDPAAVISLGLAPGEPVIRIERVGLNLADFSLTDNEGSWLQDKPVSGNGPAARWATVPVRGIYDALLADGIPARLSVTAGTYLCNACLYSFLEALDGRIPMGFIHVPMTPELVCEEIRAGRDKTDERNPPPSMELSRIIAAVRIVINHTVFTALV